MPFKMNSEGGKSEKSARDSSASPGKRPVADAMNLRPTVAVGPSGPTSIPYVDSGSPCDEGGTGCFLSPAQRGRLIGVFGLRVTTAHGNCQTAIESLSIEQLLKKDDDLSLAAEILLDAVGGYVMKFAGEAAKKLISSGPAVFAEYGIDVAGDEVSAFAERIDLTSHIKAIAARSKAASSTLLKSDKNFTSKRRKAESRSYLTELSREVGRTYQLIRETLPAVLKDSDLIAACSSFDEAYHTVGEYKTELRAKVDRYLASGVTRIGSELETSTQLDDKPHMAGVQTDRRVVWAKTPTNQTELLYFADTISSDGRGAQHAEEPVPREFWDVAVAHHRATWGNEPRHVTLNSQASAIAGSLASVQSVNDGMEDRPVTGGRSATQP